MWHDMFSEQIPYAEKVLRTIAVYALVAVLLRLSGKRGLASLNTLDVVVMILLSNVVQNAIIGPDNSVTGGALGAVVLVGVNAVLNRAAVRNAAFARVFDGRATEVVKDGALMTRAVRRLGLRPAELEHAVRVQNGDDLSEVRSASLEPSGQLLVTLRPSEQGATKADVERLSAQLTELAESLRALGAPVRDTGRAAPGHHDVEN